MRSFPERTSSGSAPSGSSPSGCCRTRPARVLLKSEAKGLFLWVEDLGERVSDPLPSAFAEPRDSVFSDLSGSEGTFWVLAGADSGIL